MLQLFGSADTNCAGITRRDVLSVGTLGLGGLTLDSLLRDRAAAATRGETVRKTSVIFVELAGGPTHFETYDPKPTAPEEYRGVMSAIDTALPGVQFSELMVEQAKIADQLAVIRSITHTSSSHGTSSHLTQTGYYLRDPQKRENDMPCAGSITARARGTNTTGIPAFVSIPAQMRFGGPAYLGKQFAPFIVSGDNDGQAFQVSNLELVEGLNATRLEDRRYLHAALDARRRVLDNQGVADSVDQFSREAYDIVLSGRARQAFDITAESDAIRDRYGRNLTGQSMLLARRLIEAGSTFVTVRVVGWDDHTNLEASMKRKGPAYDRGLATLIADLRERGLDRDVLVVAMGEFGRTPRYNKSAGRDHWGSVMSVLLAGGGYKMGQVIGSSSEKGEVPQDRPYRPEHVLNMLYRHLGIDSSHTYNDFTGRPRFILENRGVISELVG